MFARVSTYSGADPDRLVAGFEAIADQLKQIDGFSDAEFLIDRASGKAISITVWETEEAMIASQAAADSLRRQGSEAGGASIDSVEHYEIAMTVERAAAATT